MNVLSLFDGIGCAYVALKKAGIHIDNYFASEIDKKATAIAQKNNPNAIQLGDVRKMVIPSEIDLLIGGSPCQNLSVAINPEYRVGLKGTKSSLFFEYARILKRVNPKWFLLENVAMMPVPDREIITEVLGVQPIMISSCTVSAQKRVRYYWTNIVPKSFIIKRTDKGKEVLGDVLTACKKSDIVDCPYISLPRGSYQLVISGRRRYVKVVNRPDRKSPALIAHHGTCGVEGLKVLWNGKVRRINAIEAERLQGLPDNYTLCDGITENKRIALCGNGFQVDVVAGILSQIKE